MIRDPESASESLLDATPGPVIGAARRGGVVGALIRRLQPTGTTFLRFCLVGASGIMVDLGIYRGLLAAGLLNQAARAAAIFLAMNWNFAWNRRFTFQGARAAQVAPQYLRYLCSNSVGALLSWKTAMVLGGVLPAGNWPRMGAALAGIVLGTLTNFLLSLFWVFRRKRAAPS